MSDKCTALFKEWIAASNSTFVPNSTFERTHSWKQLFFGKKYTTIEIITQTMDDCKFYCQNKYSTLQRMENRYSFCGKHYFNGWMAPIREIK